MKATLDRLSKESAKQDAQIKRQNDQIVGLAMRLEKKFSKTSNKGSSPEDSNKESYTARNLTTTAKQRRTAP